VYQQGIEKEISKGYRTKILQRYGSTTIIVWK